MADTEQKTQEEQAEDLIQSFEWLDSLEEQYQYLIDLGRKLPPMNEADK
ncbi:MAG: SufE family protein, partial [Abitibacteriaceae bacterium]|nr:SufE family protein [Abditibacteriaceae bacterium]